MTEPSKAAMDAAQEIEDDCAVGEYNLVPAAALVIDRAMRPEREAAEEMARALELWGTGCSCSSASRPWDCDQCTAGYYLAATAALARYREARG